MKSTKITSLNPFPNAVDSKAVKAKDYNNLKDDFDAHISSDGVGRFNTIVPYTEGGTTMVGPIKENIAQAATTVLTAADSGKIFFIGDSAAVAYTLPTCEAGLRFKWIVIADENDATTITTSDTTDTTGEMLRGALYQLAADNDSTVVELSGDTNRIILDDNAANSACGIGSWVEIIGTKSKTWFVTGVINGTTGATGTGAGLRADVD